MDIEFYPDHVVYFPEAERAIKEYLLELSASELKAFYLRLDKAYEVIGRSAIQLKSISEGRNELDKIDRRRDGLIFLPPLGLGLLIWVSSLFQGNQGYAYALLVCVWILLVFLPKWHYQRVETSNQVLKSQILLGMLSREAGRIGLSEERLLKLAGWAKENDPNVQKLWKEEALRKHGIEGEKLYLLMKADFAADVGSKPLSIYQFLETPKARV